MIRSALVFALAALTGAADPPLLSPSEFAAYMQPKLPMRVGSSGLVTAITAEGKTLVWHVQVPDQALDTLARVPDERLAAVVAEGWCRHPPGPAFFKAGYALRWDYTSKRHPAPRRIVIHSCK